MLLIKKLCGIKSKESNLNLTEESIVNLHEMQSNNQSPNPFLNNRIHLDYQLDKVDNLNKNLILQRNVLAGLLLVSILSLVYLGGQTKKEAIVTLVNDKGQTVQPINLREMKDSEQRDKIITKIIEETLINIRTVTPDRNLQYELGKRALVNLRRGSQAYTTVVNGMKEDNPNSPYIIGQKHMVTPIIKSTMTRNINFNGETTKRASLAIEWRERVNRLDGTYLQTNEYKGDFIFDIVPPETEEEIRKNPFGIQIYAIQVVPVRIVDIANDNQPLNKTNATQGKE